MINFYLNLLMSKLLIPKTKDKIALDLPRTKFSKAESGIIFTTLQLDIFVDILVQ